MAAPKGVHGRFSPLSPGYMRIHKAIPVGNSIMRSIVSYAESNDAREPTAYMTPDDVDEDDIDEQEPENTFNQCCGNGCENCVIIEYMQKMDEYNERKKLREERRKLRQRQKQAQEQAQEHAENI